MKDENDLKVFITSKETTCDECGEYLGYHAWIILSRSKGALCLSCGDLDHLVYLPAGDPAITRRSRKYSSLAAVVLKWSRARKRYERQGILVEEKALERAEEECLADAEIRERRREREAVRREEIDKQYADRFAKRVLEIFPSCPPDRAVIIAEHACLKYSGRIGRSADAKNLDEEAIRMAVRAHVRHTETRYDELLGSGYDRQGARSVVTPEVEAFMRGWEQGR
jgi:hypothetical protein